MTKVDVINQRKIDIMTMEFVIRTVVEDEDIYLLWLEQGVPDAMIPYKSFDTTLIDDDDWMLTDEGFEFIKKTYHACIARHIKEMY